MRTSPARLFVRSFLIAGLLAVLPARGQAPAFLVKDINPDQPAPRAEETYAESEGVGSLFYYVANDGTHGDEVWRTDGTPAGTFLLKDICPGACSPVPSLLTGSNGLLFFVGYDPLQGLGLWKSDGTPGGTSLLKGDLNGPQGFGSLVIPSLADAGGKLLFTVLNASSAVEIWVTDGTQGGTHAVGNAAGGFLSFAPPRFLAVDHGQVLFAAQDSLTTWEPWVTDGTNAGTHRLSDVNPGAGNPIRFYNIGPAAQEAVTVPWGGFVFVADDGTHGPEIWRTDGTAAGTTLIKDITPGSSGSSPSGLTVLNGKVLFKATDPTHGSEIWATDGTAAGTTLLLDVWPGGSGSDPREITVVGSQAFFRAADGTHGTELWATNGTTAGTRMVKDLLPGSADGLPPTNGGYLFTPVGGRLVFYAPMSVGGFGSFWTSDGTDAGTQPLAPASGSWPYVDVFSQGIGNSQGIDNHGVAGGRLFFRGDFNPSFWVTDGTMAGSYKILDVPVATSAFAVSSGTLEPYLLAGLNGALFFQATDGTNNYELWRSDGTAAGTSQVSGLGGSSLPRQLRTVNGRLAFSDASGRLGLSDGTTAGTEIVPGSSAVALATQPLGNELLFLSQPDSAPAGLWKTDGTEAGTVLVAPQTSPVPFGSPVPAGGKLFYSLLSGSGYDLWVSDGTAGGTSMIGSGLSPQNLTDAGGTLFFSGVQPALFRYTLWKSDGTAAGTVPVGTAAINPGLTPFAVLPGGAVLFPADDGTHGEELWRSDGTGAGTVLVRDIRPGPASSRISGLMVAGNQAFFTAADGIHGLELWVSDGTAAGTHLVQDVVPGAGSSFPSNLTAVGSTLVFSAFDPAYGVEAWRSDGTGAGTWRLADVAPGPLSSSPLGFTAAGAKLYFTADDNTTGFELWAIPRKYVTGTFTDVPPNYWAWRFVEALAAGGVTAGCGGGNFCPAGLVTRAQMAIFVLTSRGTPPPAATGTLFQDVPLGYWAGRWIEQLAREGAAPGCSASPPLFCPDNNLTRADMAIWLVNARHENPPPATGTRFADVPANYYAARWIEQLAADGITAGCGGGNYCPEQPITRGEMAVFLAVAFHLPLP